jgi:hypothetical protein
VIVERNGNKLNADLQSKVPILQKSLFYQPNFKVIHNVLTISNESGQKWFPIFVLIKSFVNVSVLIFSNFLRS